MQVSHSSRAVSASFDDPNLVSAAGLVPVMALAARTGLGGLVDEWVKLPGYFGANAGMKVMALAAGMLTGADSVDLCRYWYYADSPWHGAARPRCCGASGPVTLVACRRIYRASRKASSGSVGR